MAVTEKGLKASYSRTPQRKQSDSHKVQKTPIIH